MLGIPNSRDSILFCRNLAGREFYFYRPMARVRAGAT